MIGLGLMCIGTLVFVYYTCWVFLQPFGFDWFPPRAYAIKIPFSLLILGVSLIAALFALNRKKKKSQ